MKQVGLRLSEEVLTRVDSLEKYSEGGRSEALRALIELGLNHDTVLAQIDALSVRIDRMTHVLEMAYQLAYISVAATVDGRPDVAKKLGEFKTLANAELVGSLTRKFGS